MAHTEEREMTPVQIDAQSDNRLSLMLQWCDQHVELNNLGYKAYDWDFDRKVLDGDNLWHVVFKFEDANVASMFRLRWV